MSMYCKQNTWLSMQIHYSKACLEQVSVIKATYSILVTLSHKAVTTANILNVTCDASSIFNT